MLFKSAGSGARLAAGARDLNTQQVVYVCRKVLGLDWPLAPRDLNKSERRVLDWPLAPIDLHTKADVDLRLKVRGGGRSCL